METLLTRRREKTLGADALHHVATGTSIPRRKAPNIVRPKVWRRLDYADEMGKWLCG